MAELTANGDRSLTLEQVSADDADLQAGIGSLAGLVAGSLGLPELLAEVASFAVGAIPGADGNEFRWGVDDAQNAMTSRAVTDYSEEILAERSQNNECFQGNLGDSNGHRCSLFDISCARRSSNCSGRSALQSFHVQSVKQNPRRKLSSGCLSTGTVMKNLAIPSSEFV